MSKEGLYELSEERGFAVPRYRLHAHADSLLSEAITNALEGDRVIEIDGKEYRIKSGLYKDEASREGTDHTHNEKEDGFISFSENLLEPVGISR